jgi:hypothetical protein
MIPISTSVDKTASSDLPESDLLFPIAAPERCLQELVIRRLADCLPGDRLTSKRAILKAIYDLAPDRGNGHRKGFCSAPIEQLRTVAGCKRRAAEYALSWLEGNGWILVVKPGDPNWPANHDRRRRLYAPVWRNLTAFLRAIDPQLLLPIHPADDTAFPKLNADISNPNAEIPALNAGNLPYEEEDINILLPSKTTAANAAEIDALIRDTNARVKRIEANTVRGTHTPRTSAHIGPEWDQLRGIIERTALHIESAIVAAGWRAQQGTELLESIERSAIDRVLPYNVKQVAYHIRNFPPGSPIESKPCAEYLAVKSCQVARNRELHLAVEERRLSDRNALERTLERLPETEVFALAARAGLPPESPSKLRRWCTPALLRQLAIEIARANAPPVSGPGANPCN